MWVVERSLCSSNCTRRIWVGFAAEAACGQLVICSSDVTHALFLWQHQGFRLDSASGVTSTTPMVSEESNNPFPTSRVCFESIIYISTVLHISKPNTTVRPHRRTQVTGTKRCGNWIEPQNRNELSGCNCKLEGQSPTAPIHANKGEGKRVKREVRDQTKNINQGQQNTV